MIKWKRLGRIFSPEHKRYEHSLRASHCAVPFVEQLEGDLYKIYFSSRDLQGRSHTWSLVIDIKNPKEILEVADKPILAPGNLGCFDDSGAMGSQIIEIGKKKYLYYFGWNLGKTVPFRNSIGLAISEDNSESFKKFSEGPLIDRNYKEPHFCATPCILVEEGVFKCWYLSCVKWSTDDKGLLRHHYHIKYAESDNGIDWNRQGKVAIDFEDEGEYAISVPSVIKENGIYKMWFSSRGHKYKVRYAESSDGINFKRFKEPALSGSGDGWESDMVEYPHVFMHEGLKYMLYNGNDYGKTGFGIAVEEK